jgi:hypothetical protein
MSKSACMWLGLGLALASAGAAAQTVNQIPKYQTSTTFSDSPISVSGGNVGIGTTSAKAQLSVATGADNSFVVAQDPTYTHYALLTFNGNIADAGYQGFGGGLMPILLFI